ncbi:MAG: hypothetical protein Q9160_004123 [Pyrenula sp. 1 TL-2023]
MGVGRRMKKQGPPPTFAQIQASKKRKAAETITADVTSKSKRRAVETQPLSRKPSFKPLVKQQNGLDRPSVPPKQKAQQKRPPLSKLSSDEDLSEDLRSDAASLSDSSATPEHMDDFDLNGLSSDDAGGSRSDGIEDDSNDSYDEVFDSDEGHDLKAQFSEDEDASDAEEQLTAANIEGLSRKLDQEQATVETEARQELEEAALQTNIREDNDNSGLFDTANQQRPELAPDLQLLRTRITDTIRILSDFSNLSEPGRPRSDYISLLLSDMTTYYSYTPYLAEKLFSIFTPAEAFAFFEANETPRPVVLRTNTLRTTRRTLAQSLINRGVVLEPLPGKWSKVGLQIFESAVPLGATPEYLAGHYILQAASSFLPCIALAPQPGDRILDMAAAPGGKTTYLSALMRNQGSIFANDSNRQRAKALIGNIHRLGCKNTVVTNLDAAKGAFPKVLGGFDRVLLDAPCSGTGVIGKDPSVKTSKTERDFLALPHMQKQLLLAAIDSTDHAGKSRDGAGGYIVYSTCSVTVEENEGVVQYVLSKRPNVKIVDTGIQEGFGSPGFRKYGNKRFDEKMGLARRCYPHRENVDGFFVCKMRKMGSEPKKTAEAGAGTGMEVGKGSKTKQMHVNGAKMAEEEKETLDSTEGTDAEADDDIMDTSAAHINGTTPSDDFAAFNSSEDDKYMAKAERNWLRRRGVDPRAAGRNKRKDQR